jgi:surface protein
MKKIKNYINERLHITSKSFYTCHPQTKDELREIIIQRIKDEGPECDLNDIDVSKITNMLQLFDAGVYDIFKDFNGDISQWNVLNVKNMGRMFYKCKKFNCDISRWDVSNVTTMGCMFCDCVKFNCDLSGWNVSNVNDMLAMFFGCEQFNCDLSQWDVSNVEDIESMFLDCKNFNQNLDKWNVSNVKNNMKTAFLNCPTQPKWYDRNKYETEK